MAKRTVVVLSDDLDGSESAEIETVTFEIDGVAYEIDLSPKNADAIREALEPFVNAGRKVAGGSGGRAKSGGYTRTTVRPSGRSNKAINEAIRNWAAANGFNVSDRGRIKRNIIDAYDAANGTKTL